MLHTEAISPELLEALKQLMQVESLRSFRLVGGTALALQLGHRDSEDIDLFSSNDFPDERIRKELTEKFDPKDAIQVRGGIMINLWVNGVKVDIIDYKHKFIRDVVVEDGIRMAHLEEIIAMKIKTTCDPFSGRKTQKDLADIATLLDRYTIQEMLGFFEEKYPTMRPYSESVILQLNRNLDQAERNSKMPKMHNGLTWETTLKKIEKGLQNYFQGILEDREKKLKRQ